MYEVLLERGAEKDLRRLAEDDFRRVVRALRALAHDPQPRGSRKIAGSQNDWRIRVGDYRVIYELDEEAASVAVLRVRRRKEAYR